MFLVPAASQSEDAGTRRPPAHHIVQLASVHLEISPGLPSAPRCGIPAGPTHASLPGSGSEVRGGGATHLVAGGRQELPERLDGAEPVEVDQLRHTAVRLTASSHGELAPCVLADD